MNINDAIIETFRTMNGFIRSIRDIDTFDVEHFERHAEINAWTYVLHKHVDNESLDAPVNMSRIGEICRALIITKHRIQQL